MPLNMGHVVTARAQLAQIKDIMLKHNMDAFHPLALLVFEDNEQLIVVMEWHSPEEQQKVLSGLREDVLATDAKAVIFTATGNAIVTELGSTPVRALFASIHAPNSPVYTLGEVYTKVEGETVFGKAYNGNISPPFQIPTFWNETYPTLGKIQ